MQGVQGRRWISIIALLFAVSGAAQEVKIRGGFLEDSLLIGEDVNFWMSASYPPELEMVFPDSLSSFAPFEFSGKKYFPTRIQNGLAVDSTLYTIQSFEIDLVQYLQLQAVILADGDSTMLKTPMDSIYLTELAPMVSDSTKLRENLSYQDVNTQFNYPLMYYILGAMALIAIILLLVFGKRMIRWFKLRKLRTQYEQFLEVFSSYITKLKVDPDPELAEKGLIFWKNYLQILEKQPYTVLTTKEILSLKDTQELEPPLKAIDRVVYGKRVQENVFQDFQQLEEFAQDRYSKKVEEIKDGK